MADYRHLGVTATEAGERMAAFAAGLRAVAEPDVRAHLRAAVEHGSSYTSFEAVAGEQPYCTICRRYAEYDPETRQLHCSAQIQAFDRSVVPPS